MTMHYLNKPEINAFSLLFLITVGCSGILAQDVASPWQQYQQAADLFQQQGASQQIITLLKEVQRTTQDPVLYGRAVFLSAETYQRTNQSDKAILELQKVSDLSRKVPDNMQGEAWFRTALIYLKQNQIRSARSYFTKVLESRCNTYIKNEARFGLAWMAADQQQWQACDSLLTQLLISDSLAYKDERFTILKARDAIGLGQPQEAIRLLATTTSRMGLYFLAKAQETAGNRIMAVSVYKKLHDLYPNTPEAQQALFQAAEVFMRAGDWLAARSEFKRLLQGGLENDDAIHFRLGWIHLNLNELDAALIEFRFPASPENSSYFKFMEAECLRRQGVSDPVLLDKSIILFHNIASIDLNSSLAPLAKLKAALAEMEKGDRNGALVSMRQFLKLYPKDELVPAVYFLLGANEQPPANQRYFDQIIQQSRKSPFFDVAYFALQNHDFSLGDYQKIITRQAAIPHNGVSDQPNYWQRANHLLMGESAYFLKHYQQAFSEYQQCVGSHKDDLAEKALIGQAWCKLQIAGPDTALLMFDDLRKTVRGENKPLADFGYATVQFLRQEYTEALRAYPVALNTTVNPEFSPMVIQALFRSAECYFRLQYYMQAIEMWNRLVTQFPSSPFASRALFNIADIYFRANHFTEADSVYSLLITQYPQDPLSIESHLKLAQSAYNSTDYQTAISRYQTFIEKYPQHEKNIEALEGIQLSYYQMGQIDQASETLKKVIDQTANSDLAIDARYRLAVNYFQEENFQLAVESFKEILTLYPNSSYAVDAQFALSKCYLAQQNYRMASEEFLRFIQYFPQSVQLSEAYFLLGVSYYQLESYLSAIDYFGKVVTDFPESEYYAPALKNAGWCYERLQDRSKALANFSTYVQKYPSAEDHSQIQLQIARLLSEEGQNPEAIRKFETLTKNPDPVIATEAGYRLGMLYLAQDQLPPAEKVFLSAARMEVGDNFYRLSAMAQLAAIYESRGDSQKAIVTYQMLMDNTSEERWTMAARERIHLLQAGNTP